MGTMVGRKPRSCVFASSGPYCPPGLCKLTYYCDRIRTAESSLMGRLIFTIAVLVFIAGAHAQTVAGVVRGVIADPSGGHVPGATVTLTSQETGVRRSAASDAYGDFAITAVPPGEYRLEVEHRGFLNTFRR